MLYPEGIHCLARKFGSFSESNMKNSTRPEEHPRHTVDNDEAVTPDRHSGGNHSTFSEFQVMHVPSELTPCPWHCGTSRSMLFVSSISETVDKEREPLSVSRHKLLMSNDFTMTLPTFIAYRHWPLLASHTLTVRSYEAEARNLESGEKTTDLTGSLWPSRVWRHWPLLISYILTVWSAKAEARSLESGKTTTDLIQSLWSLTVWKHWPLLASQTLTVWSSEAKIRSLESGEKMTELTKLLWPLKI